MKAWQCLPYTTDWMSSCSPLQLTNLRDFRHATFSEVTAIHSERYVNMLEEVGLVIVHNGDSPQ